MEERFLRSKLCFEKVSGIAVGHLRHLFHAHAKRVGNLLCNQRYICALVALAAVRHWRQIRAVGLKQYAVQSDRFEKVVDMRVFKRNDSIDAEIEIAITAYAVQVGQRASETVKHAFGQRASETVKHITYLIKSIATVDDYGQVARRRPTQLFAKRLHLLLAVGAVPIKVDAHLSYRHKFVVVEMALGGIQLFNPVCLDVGCNPIAIEV